MANIKILKPEEVNSIELFHQRPNSPNRKIFDLVLAIKPKEGMLIKKSEWKGRALFPAAIHSLTYLYKRKGWGQSEAGKLWTSRKFTIRQVKDRSSWLVVRLK